MKDGGQNCRRGMVRRDLSFPLLYCCRVSTIFQTKTFLKTGNKDSLFVHKQNSPGEQCSDPHSVLTFRLPKTSPGGPCAPGKPSSFATVQPCGIHLECVQSVVVSQLVAFCLLLLLFPCSAHWLHFSLHLSQFKA